MGTRKTSKKAEARAAALRMGLDVKAPAPVSSEVWLVRYIRTNGDVASRHFFHETTARKYADRLTGFGKQPTMFRATTRWVRSL